MCGYTNSNALMIFSDGWSDRFDVVEGQEEVALGGLSVRIHSPYVADFDEYYFALKPHNNARNPWFEEFWEGRFQCLLQQQQQQQQQKQQLMSTRSSSDSYNSRLARQRPACTGNESLRVNYKQDAKMAFVVKAIVTMALGLDKMRRKVCGAESTGLCSALLPINGSLLLQHLMDVSFSYLNESLCFDEHGDPPGQYEILNFRRRANSVLYQNVQAHMQLQPNPVFTSNDSLASLQLLTRRNDLTCGQPSPLDKTRSRKSVHAVGDDSRRVSRSSASRYEYVQVGEWKSGDGLKMLEPVNWADHALIPNSVGTPDSDDDELGPQILPPESVCSRPCPRGHAKVSARNSLASA